MTQETATAKVLETLSGAFPEAHIRTWVDQNSNDVYVMIEEPEIYYGESYKVSVARLETEILWPNGLYQFLFVTRDAPPAPVQDDASMKANLDVERRKRQSLELLLRSLVAELSSVRSRVAFLEARLLQMQTVSAGYVPSNIGFVQAVDFLSGSIQILTPRAATHTWVFKTSDFAQPNVDDDTPTDQAFRRILQAAGQ